MKNIIKIRNLSKIYRIGSKEQQSDTLIGSFTDFINSPINNFRKIFKLSSFKDLDEEDTIWALKDISLNIEEGGLYGIIGPNGAGKSTLLKILSRITWPSGGEVQINGKISSLLEVGTGFHQDLTGRENIYLNGTYLGMTKKDVDKNFKDIVEFANVAKFIDTPVKRYSTGMRMRLAFSVAAFLDSDILLIDEVLAVGDASFQKKCLGKMDELATSKGRTILFVSHQISALQSLCKYGLLIEKGQLVFQGNINDAIDVHLKNQKEKIKTLKRFKKHDNIRVNIFEAYIKNNKIIIKYDYSLKSFTNNLCMGFVLIDMKGNRIINTFDVENLSKRNPGNYTSTYSFDSSYLLSGDYIVKSIIVFREVEWYEREEIGVKISIPYQPRNIYNSGILRRIGEWNISNKNEQLSQE
jgi:lipopolysaccharide transport system ATP-binding protein